MVSKDYALRSKLGKTIREELRLKPGDKIIFEKEGNRVILKPAKTLLDFRGYVKLERRIPAEILKIYRSSISSDAEINIIGVMGFKLMGLRLFTELRSRERKK